MSPFTSLFLCAFFAHNSIKDVKFFVFSKLYFKPRHF